VVGAAFGGKDILFGSEVYLIATGDQINFASK
jgi:hypothetical protein